MSITVGPKPLVVSSVGRFVVSGNTAAHTMKIIDAATGTQLASVSVATAGGTAGTFAYANLASPVTFNANSTYYIVSLETLGGDQWYENNTTAQTTGDATLAGAVYGDSSTYTAIPMPGRMYVPVNIKYVVSSSVGVLPTSVALSASQTQQFTGTVNGSGNTSVTWSLSPNVGSLSASGLYTAPAFVAATQTVTVTATSVADPTKSASATVTLTPVSITLAPPTASLFATQTQQFTPTVNGAINTAVTWSLNPNVGSISGTGLYTAPSSIASSQTVTVTAFSVADSSKSATATITLNPPAPPVITQAPQSSSVSIGQTAGFTVTATGAGLTYQWQSMPSGGSFSNIASATSSSYTTPVLSLADSGTQFRVVVTNPQGSVTSSAATVTVQPAGLTLVTSKTLGQTRNNYTGWVGMKFTVGAAPMTVTSLGRIVGPGNSAAHIVKIVDAASGNDVAGASASVATLGGTTGAFVYSSLSSPVTLPANTSYYLVSQETQGGDQWYDLDSVLTTTTAAAVTGPVYGLPYAASVSAGHSYVPVDLKYTVSVSVTVAPPTVTLFDSQTQQFSATVSGTANQSVTWTLSPNVGTISAAGLYTAPTPIASTQSITVTATSVADVTKSATATVTLSPPSPPVITQQPQSTSAISGQTGSFSVTASGLGLSYQWQSMAAGAASFTNIAGALSSSYTTPSVTFADSGTQFRVVVTNAQGSVTSNAATLSVLSPGTPFITSFTPGTQRNNYTGWVGMKFTVGPTPLVVSSLGRIVIAGNNHGHNLKIVDANTNTDLGTAAITTVGGTAGTFVYGNLAAPVTLNANSSYLILSQEEDQVDQWYDNTATALTTTDAALVGSTYGGGAPYTTYTNPGHMYVGVSFKYALQSAVNINPTSATLSASQTQQFTSTVAGGVSWSISPNVGTISASGLYSPPANIASTQTVTVTATSVTDNTKSASAAVTLIPVSVTVAPPAAPLFASQTQQFTATVTGTNNTSVNWTINPNVGSISASGLYTAPSSIASVQTVTVTATSVADNTKFATATVTLEPPAPPIITVAPQNAAVFSGQTATFSVTASGLNLTYQWQIMPSGGSFTDIAGATSTSYTTPTLALSDNGTQFRVVVTNPQGSVPSNAATLSVLQAGVTLVTSKTLGTARNNFTGWVGMKITVGGAPMTVSSVGRAVGPNNTAVHTVKIVDAITGNDLASASVATTGLAPGTFAYGNLGSPVTLNANAAYYIVSQETIGGDQWYDLDSTVQTTTAATVNGPVYGTPYAPGGPAGHSYVPVDLKYNASVSVTVAPPTASLFDSQTQQFTATVNGAGNTAVTWTINPNVGTISTGGLYTAPAPITTTQTITVTATSVADVTKSASATVTLNPPAPPSITQAPQNASVVVGQTANFSVTASGLGLSYQWQSMAPGGGSFTNIAGATASSYTTPATALADGGTQFRVVVTNAQGSATSNAATLSVVSPGTVFATSVVLGPGRNDYSGYVGMKITIGPSALVVSSVGRYVAPLNAQSHTVTIIDAATGNQLGTASVNTAGGTVGTFAYANLASPVTLNANAIYYIMSQETQGGDQWYDNTTTAQTTADANLMGSVYGVGWPYISHDTAGRMYVPVNFKYVVGSLMTVAPNTATLSASQTQQFTATISSGNNAVTWSINPNVGSISSTGLYTAPASIASAQSVTVTATSVADNTKSASATVTLTPVAVTIAPNSVALSGGQTQQFTPTVTGTGTTSVNWTINPNVGSVSAAGLYTAPATVTSGQTVTVTATSTVDNTKSGSATVTLVPVAVTVAPPTASLFASQTQQYTATVTGTGNTSVTWSIGASDPGSISGTGLYTAPSSIASTQTVTVTATSVADNTKLGTATVTLNPPLPPSITQQPQATTVQAGQTATFSVTASGLNLSYQWQSMPSGGSFSNIAGATSSSYTTPVTNASDSGTQFRCVVTNPQGSATSNPATLTVQLAGVNFITSRTPGTDRNNYSGYVGMTITVGPVPMTVSSIGRFIGVQHSNTHLLKIVDASNSTDVASVSISTTGAAPGTFVYGNLASAVTLTANHVYYVVSQEAAGADDWYDADSLVQTTSAATVTGPVYGLPYAPATQAGHSYVILDLKYTVPVSVSVAPGTSSLSTNQTQQFTATVTGTATTSVTWTLSPNVGTISAAGLYTAPSSIASTQSVTVTATSVADVTKSASATVTLNPPAPPAITQQPQSATTLVGQTATFSVTASGTGLSYQWQSMPSGGSFSNISGATSSTYTTPLAALADNGTQFRCVVTNGQGSATSNAATLSVSNATAFVTSKTLGTARSDYSGWLGVKITVGNASMIVGALGRIVAPGNVGTHVVKIVNATTGADIASVTVATSGGTAGTFAYTALSTPVTLNANTSYFILSQEGQIGEAWYDNDTSVTNTADAVVSGAIYGTTAPYSLASAPAGHMYVPVDFKYALGQ
ncbi:MAG: immunoglobulin domain-containing protein [Acidobacteriia bacterium]|nr:immunoglobulin domain-containing protein [Terriglobia bacterium]